MKNRTIQRLIVLAVISVAGIAVTQIYWMKRAFDLKQSEFERGVSTALFNVAQKIFEINNTPSPVDNPVRQLSTNYFVVMVNSEISAHTLEFLLQSEFARRDISTDFEYGVYDCTSQTMVYGNYIPSIPEEKPASTKPFPTWLTQGYYFGVQFPNHEGQILNQMGIWIFSSAVLLIVIVFFSYALVVILRQKRLSEVQKDFINNMTHEFKTPISTIALSSQVLKDPQIRNQPERLMKYATLVEKENLRLKHQVDRVLQMARDEKQITFQKHWVDVHDVITEVSHDSSLGLKERNGNIHCDLQATRSSIKADRLHLTNVLYNLLDNAIKYCEREPNIVITTCDDVNGFVLKISDNGIGVRSEDQKKIFEKFYRVPTGNLHNVKGFGLGLSYVKGIVEAHGGNISITSEPGAGSTFTIAIR